ncbi:hypothetical protein M569_07114 [Genlisea aurea]|uniref:Uncharacterized protein n=1 Tax=Genlisea aurea TaxID=192259 RepID=S8CS21_9LAMI|nr:hypothetical protein M569_07114 [Genlisea aurea]
MAWEVYRRTLESQEARQVSPEEGGPAVAATAAAADHQKIPPPPPHHHPVAGDEQLERIRERHRCRHRTRSCTDLSHLMLLRTQKVKAEGFAVCGECARAVGWGEVRGAGRKWIDNSSCWSSSSGFRDSGFDLALPQSSS